MPTLIMEKRDLVSSSECSRMWPEENIVIRVGCMWTSYYVMGCGYSDRGEMLSGRLKGQSLTKQLPHHSADDVSVVLSGLICRKTSIMLTHPSHLVNPRITLLQKHPFKYHCQKIILLPQSTSTLNRTTTHHTASLCRGGSLPDSPCYEPWWEEPG